MHFSVFLLFFFLIKGFFKSRLFENFIHAHNVDIPVFLKQMHCSLCDLKVLSSHMNQFIL